MRKQWVKAAIYFILIVVADAVLADQQIRSVTEFSAIEINGPFDAMIALGQSPGLVIEGDEDILPWVTSSVKKGQLIVNIKPGIHPHYSKRVKLTIVTPRLDALVGDNHALVELGDLQANQLTVSLDNHSSVIGNEIHIKQTTTLTLSNHSQIKIDGSTQQLIINGTNHIRVMADDFNNQNATVTLSNHSHAELSSQTVVTDESNHSSLTLSYGLQKISGHLQDHSTADVPKSQTIQSVLSNDSEWGA